MARRKVNVIVGDEGPPSPADNWEIHAQWRRSFERGSITQAVEVWEARKAKTDHGKPTKPSGADFLITDGSTLHSGENSKGGSATYHGYGTTNQTMQSTRSR
jgi:hypothetical protein